jgi:hypothetical protein
MTSLYGVMVNSTEKVYFELIYGSFNSEYKFMVCGLNLPSRMHGIYDEMINSITRPSTITVNGMD